MMGFDTAASCAKYAPRLGGLGYQFACRYLANDWRGLKPDEIAAFSAAGIAIVSIHEMGAGAAFNALLGAQQAASALRLAQAIGQPEGSAIYFAIDTDRVRAEDVLEHFEAIKAAGLPYEAGVYGPGAFCQALLDAGLVRWTWLANAKGWPGYAAFKDRADILQSLPMRPFPPDVFAIDPDETKADDFGQWSA